MFQPIKTLREADKLAKQLKLTRGKGTYNEKPFWVDSLGRIITLERLAELAGLS